MAITIPLKSSNKQIIISCMIGNALEWYDFVIYGFFAPIIGNTFFPNYQPIAQALAIWGIFWSGFIVRPLGGLFFGYLGDKIGRKFAITLSIYVMAIPTTLIGLTPSFEQIGLLAPVILIILRLLQGFAMGGEFTGTIIFLVEHAKPNNRCLWGSWASFSIVIGVIVGSMITMAITNSLASEALKSWGWRIPFIICIVGGLVGGYIRQHLTDPHVFVALKNVKENANLPITPIKTLLTKNKALVGLVMLIDFLTAIGFYTLVIFLPSYFTSYLHFKTGDVFIINTINMIIFSVFIFLGGLLGDKFGRRWVLTVPCIFLFILSYPLFLMIQGGSYWSLVAMQATLAIAFGIFQGIIPVTIAEIMPMSVRYTGVSFAHNLSMAIFGGSAPFLATKLIQSTELLTAPAFMLMTASLLSFIGTFFLKTK